MDMKPLQCVSPAGQGMVSSWDRKNSMEGSMVYMPAGGALYNQLDMRQTEVVTEVGSRQAGRVGEFEENILRELWTLRSCANGAQRTGKLYMTAIVYDLDTRTTNISDSLQLESQSFQLGERSGRKGV